MISTILQFAPILLIYAFAAGLMLLLSVRTWVLRPTRGAVAWSATMLFTAIYAVGACLEVAFTDPVLKLAMNRVIYIGSTGFVFLWGIFAIYYANEEHRLNRLTVTLLAIMPVTTLTLAFFAEQHRLIYHAYEFIEFDGLIMGRVVEYGPMFWVWAVYSFLVLVGSWLLLLHAARRSPRLFRGQARLVVLASAAPMLAYILHLTGFNSLAPFDPTAPMLALSGVIMLLAMTRYRFMDIVPVAQDLIFKNVKSGIILIDLKGRVAGMNQMAEAVVGRAENEVLGMAAVHAFPNQRHLVKQFWDITDIKTEIAMTATGPYYELQITPLHSHRGDLAGRLVMLYDITQRKVMEQQTLELGLERERVRLLQQFISHMSHDLRTPLATMKTSQYLLRKDLAGQHTARLDVLDHQTDRLAEMVDSMLTLLRLEEHELDSLLDVNINDLISYVIERYKTLAGAHGAQLHFSPGLDLPPVRANEAELDLALSKLLLNAIHYTPTGGAVTLSSHRDNGHVAISVKDTGVGIAEGDLPHIFERFYRADDARGTETGGSGLGLAIAKLVADRHLGAIAVQSCLGEGSEFQLRLPVEKDGAGQA